MEFLSGELSKLDRIFSDFTSRTGVLMTIAGLLSFLPPLGIPNEDYLPNFLAWTFPFLLAALAAYYISSTRKQAVIKQIVFAPAGTAEELMRLRDRAQYLELSWRGSVEWYDKIIPWHRRTHALIYSYIVSVSANFYLFVFYGKPNIYLSILVVLLSIGVFAWMYYWTFSKSKKGIVMGEISGNLGVGGVPPSDT